MKKVIKAVLLVTAMAANPLSAADQAEPTYHRDVLIFAGDLRYYVQKAIELSKHEESKNSDPAKEELVNQLKAAGSRLSRVYFGESADVIKNELDRHLSLTLKENPTLKNYFIFIGNAFAADATKLLKIYESEQHKTKMKWLVGGAIVGVAVGSGYLYFRWKYATAPLASKDFLIAGGSLAGATAIGFGWGTRAAANLPMDMSVQNATTFAAKYPHGVDFVNSLDRSADLKLLTSEIFN
jgi:hypothetical protein